MKKLLFCISLFVLLIVGSCHSTKKPAAGDEATASTNPTSQSGNSANSGASVSISSNTQTGIDTLLGTAGGKAIIHDAPEQARLDSIKKAKTRAKQ